MNSKRIRKEFIGFFKERGHQFVSSAPLVVKNDPTLMFTNAGMNQFKDLFLGNKTAPYSKATNSQKCLRVSGKHNDLEEVGIDTYHHTMFEMLGNWSFGDYFKKEAINWAWELLTDVYNLPKDRLYVSIFAGDKKDGLSKDSEAEKIWKQLIDPDRILLFDKNDNFWEMGDVGPCGPCSEIHVDLRSDEEIEKVDGKQLVNQDHPLVIEVWNLVFIQFNRLLSGALEDLPSKHVDTGMGFERIAMAIQEKESNYDTDIFQPLISIVADKASVKYGVDLKTDIALRVVVDHIRAIAFAIADGQLPSNNKAGYVIRRILRRAVRYGYTFLGFREPFLIDLIPTLASQFDDVFPEIKAQQEFITKVVREEETSFLKTLENGLKKLDQIDNDLIGDNKTISGKVAFELYDTYGFPFDLTSLIAREKGLTVDKKTFTEQMEVQKSRSKKAAATETGDWNIVNEGDEVAFNGYETLESEAKILRYRQVKDKKKEMFQLVLDKTPFYAESGGQIGDTGYLESDGEKVYIIDTKKENDLIIHFTEQLPKNPNNTVMAVVNSRKRSLTENNHSATHLMHAALREVLGDHVQQKGSLVSENILRFDFSHFSKMSEEEVKKVEQIVNERIRENIPLSVQQNIAIEDAKKMGAMALFGEKYGDFVRVITFNKDFSVELCGGTHVTSTGQIGFFKIISESSVAAGVRRIEAITATKAEEYVNKQLNTLQEINHLFKNPKNLAQAVNSLLDEKNKLAKEVEGLQLKQAGDIKADLIKKADEIDGVKIIIQQVQVPKADLLKNIAFELKTKFDQVFMILAADVDGKPQIAILISDNLVKEKGLHAGNMVRELSKEIKGGGGGQPFFATAGGKDLGGLSRVIEKAKALANENFAF